MQLTFNMALIDPAKLPEVVCGECGAPMRLRSSPKYPRAPFWGCSRFPECRGSHGAHPDGRPLGKPCDRETKEWRTKAHDAFDTLWKCGGINMRRRRAYALLAEEMGLAEVHIAEQDIEGCKKVLAATERIMRRLGQK